jgi:hypothetical protein
LGNIGRSGELDVGRVIKTKKNTVALKSARTNMSGFILDYRLLFPCYYTRAL